MISSAPAHWVYVAVGSNLGDRVEHVHTACADIVGIPGCQSLRLSPLYESAPMGAQDQADYINAVCRFHCALFPHELLRALKRIEGHHGRDFDADRWTARPLDLDIVLFGDQTIALNDLTIPHMGLAARSFVLRPLFDLAPTLSIPGHGLVATLLHDCEDFSIRPFSSEPTLPSEPNT